MMKNVSFLMPFFHWVLHFFNWSINILFGPDMLHNHLTLPFFDLALLVILIFLKLIGFLIQNIPLLGELEWRRICFSSFCTTSDSPTAHHFMLRYLYLMLSAGATLTKTLYSFLGLSPLMLTSRVGNRLLFGSWERRGEGEGRGDTLAVFLIVLNLYFGYKAF